MRNKNIVLFIFIATVQYLVDINMYPCDKICGHIMIYIHHILDIYIYIGGFLFNPVYHLICIIFVIIHWLTNDNKCIFTQIVNKKCYPNYIEYKPFNDFSIMLGIQQRFENINYYYLLLMIIYDLKEIFKI